MSKKILDVACGSKMFWFDKSNPDVEFCDIRDVDRHEYYPGRFIEIKPDMGTKGYERCNINCGSCVEKTFCGEPADIALGCTGRMLSCEDPLNVFGYYPPADSRTPSRSIPNCPYCGKKMMIGRVDLGGGNCGYAILHANEEEGEACGREFAGTFRTPEQAELCYRRAVYYAEDC